MRQIQRVLCWVMDARELVDPDLSLIAGPAEPQYSSSSPSSSTTARRYLVSWTSSVNGAMMRAEKEDFSLGWLVGIRRRSNKQGLACVKMINNESRTRF